MLDPKYDHIVKEINALIDDGKDISMAMNYGIERDVAIEGLVRDLGYQFGMKQSFGHTHIARSVGDLWVKVWKAMKSNKSDIY